MLMRRTITSIFLALVLLLLPLADRAQQSSPDAKPQAPAPQKQETTQQSKQTITSVVNLVDVLFTVLNRRNKLVPELEKGDFKIWDDRFPQEIRYFSVQRRNKDEAFVMTFDDEPQIVQAFTSDTGALRDQITKTRAGGGTAIYDAIYEACVKELSHPPRPPGDQPDVVRRVMILISDGEDNLSHHTRSEAIELAQRTSVVIYTISTSTQWVSLSETNPEKTSDRKYHLTDGDKILQDLAEETGGRSFFPYHVDDLDQSFQDIGDELRNQ